MYGVYIVDDEKMVVTDLIDAIPWLDFGFKVIGSSTSPGRALAEIVDLKPDVVFSDLRMPGPNDGIELIKRVQESCVDTEFVLLSAFADFEASRSFFTMGGVDYLLKPMNQDDAALVLEKVSRKIAAKHNMTPSVRFAPSQSTKFDLLVAYVTKNFSKKITLVGLSEKFNMSQTYICDLFAKHYDSTLKIFITNLRMNEASRLLLETDAPIKEIASHCGYSDHNYFCKIYKAHSGKSPTEFKEGRD